MPVPNVTSLQRHPTAIVGYFIRTDEWRQMEELRMQITQQHRQRQQLVIQDRPNHLPPTFVFQHRVASILFIKLTLTC